MFFGGTPIICERYRRFERKDNVLSECKSGTLSTVATGTLVNDFDASKLHTVRVSSRDGKVDVVFDNMTKIDDASLNTSAGKIGYKDFRIRGGGYTAYSNVAMGMSDQREAKQALGTIGASTISMKIPITSP
ncbi:MAG: hypothetical protein ACLRSW_08770 [Christensenellaceae bacterium]